MNSDKLDDFAKDAQKITLAMYNCVSQVNNAVYEFGRGKPDDAARRLRGVVEELDRLTRLARDRRNEIMADLPYPIDEGEK